MTTLSEQAIQTLEVIKDLEIAAPVDVVFESILEQMGALNESPDGRSLAMKIEPWPGRPLVQRSGKQCRPRMGACAVD